MNAVTFAQVFWCVIGGVVVLGCLVLVGVGCFADGIKKWIFYRQDVKRAKIKEATEFALRCEALLDDLEELTDRYVTTDAGVTIEFRALLRNFRASERDRAQPKKNK